jgi:hypothetical protein
MLADLHAIHTLGSAGAAQAADLDAVAIRLSSVPAAPAAATFGPVGARFLAALAEAAALDARAVAALSDSVSAAGVTAHASATAYDAAERRASRLLGA